MTPANSMLIILPSQPFLNIIRDLLSQHICPPVSECDMPSPPHRIESRDYFVEKGKGGETHKQ